MSRRPGGAPFAATLLAAGFGLLLTAQLASSLTVAQDRPRPRDDRQGRRDQPVVHEISGSVPAGPRRLRVDTAIGTIRLRPAHGLVTVYRVRLRHPARRRRGAPHRPHGGLPPAPGTAAPRRAPAAPDPTRGLTAEFEIDVPPAIG
jgi:hypothetical protein